MTDPGYVRNSNFHSGELIFCFNVFFVTCHFYSSLDDGEIKYLVVYLSLTHSFNYCFLCNCIINHMKTPVSSSSPKALVHILFCLCLCSVVLFPPVAMSLTTITTEKTSTTGKQEEKLGSGPSSSLYFLKADLYSGFWTHWLLAQVFPAISRRLIMLTLQRPRGRTLSRETSLYWVVTMEPKMCYGTQNNVNMDTNIQMNKTVLIERDCYDDMRSGFIPATAHYKMDRVEQVTWRHYQLEINLL